MIIIADIVVISSKLVIRSSPSMAFRDIFINNKSIGIIMGKPKIAIKVPLLEAFDAILEIMVNVTENPIELSNRHTINKARSVTGFPKSRI